MSFPERLRPSGGIGWHRPVPPDLPVVQILRDLRTLHRFGPDLARMGHLSRGPPNKPSASNIQNAIGREEPAFKLRIFRSGSIHLNPSEFKPVRPLPTAYFHDF